MAVTMTIGGTQVLSNKNFTITEEILKTSSTVLNNCYPLSWEATHDYTSLFFYPEDYSNCLIYNNSKLVFGGIVKNSGDTSLRPTDPKYCSLQILDYKTLLSEGIILDFVISNKTISEAISMVVSAISDYGFIIGNIALDNPDEIIGAYSTLNKSPYDVLQYFSEISGSRWFTRLISNTQNAIDFYSPDQIPQATQIEYTTQYFEENNIVNIDWSFGTRDYRNKQIILSKQVYSSILSTETLFSDGYSTKFNLTQNVAIISNIAVNGQQVTFATQNDKSLGIYADFYYSPGSPQIEANVAYSAGTNITINYRAFVQGRQVVSNDSEISRIATQTGRNGTISRYEDRNDVLSSDELNKVAQTYINYKGKPEIILKVLTQNNDILNIGQQVYFNIPSFTQLQQNYLVKKKEIQITSTGNEGVIYYQYELSSSYDVDSAINYFDNQRRKANGNISEGQFITRNIDINNTANIKFQNKTETELTIVNNNVLNANLDCWLVK